MKTNPSPLNAGGVLAVGLATLLAPAGGVDSVAAKLVTLETLAL